MKCQDYIKMVDSFKDSDMQMPIYSQAYYDFMDIIDNMSDQDRKKLRLELEAAGCQKIVKSLYFNYDTQKVIE